MKLLKVFVFCYPLGCLADEVKPCALNGNTEARTIEKSGRRKHAPYDANQFLTRPARTEPARRSRSTPYRSTFIPGGPRDDCEWGAISCLRVHKTGLLCGRTTYFMYDTFRNACELDFVNCVLGYEMWMIVHMGECIPEADLFANVVISTYMDREYFLDNNYVDTDVLT